MVASYPNICQVSLHFWKPQWLLLNPGCFQKQSTPHFQVFFYICAIVSCQPLRHRSFAPFRSWMSSNSWLPDLFIAVSWCIWMFVGPSPDFLKFQWISMDQYVVCLQKSIGRKALTIRTFCGVLLLLLRVGKFLDVKQWGRVFFAKWPVFVDQFLFLMFDL